MHIFCFTYSGEGLSIMIESSVSFTSFLSCRLAPSIATERGMPFPSVCKLLFVPFLPRSVGFAPVPAKPRGVSVIAPSIACHYHSNPFFISYSSHSSFSYHLLLVFQISFLASVEVVMVLFSSIIHQLFRNHVLFFLLSLSHITLHRYSSIFRIGSGKPFIPI